MDLNRLRILSGLELIIETEELNEVAPTDQEEFVKNSKSDFKKRYGKRWKQVLYATAWKNHNKKDTKEAVDIADSIYGLVKIQEEAGIDVPDNKELGSEPHNSYYIYDRCKRKGHRVNASSLVQAVEYVAPGAELYQGDPETASPDAPAKYLGADECQYQAFPTPSTWGFHEGTEDENLTNKLNESTEINENITAAKHLADRGRGDDPTKNGNHDSDFPKIDFIDGPKNALNVTTVEFNDDKFEFNKKMTGQDVEEGTKIEVPSDVMKSIDKRIKELNDSIETWDKSGYNQDGAIYKNVKHNAIELLEKFKELLNTKTVQAYKDAQVLYGTLMSPIFDLLPTQLINYLHNGHANSKKKI